MHKLVLMCGAVLALCMSLTSCESNSEIKDFVEQLQKANAASDTAGLRKMYPDSKLFEMNQFSLERDKVVVEPVESDGAQYKVILNDSTRLLLLGLSDGSFRVEKSWGLLAIPKADAAIAKATGWVKKDLTDAENGKRLSNNGFRKYMSNKLAEIVKNVLKIENIQYKNLGEKEIDWFDDEKTEPMMWSYEMKTTFDVVNISHSAISADDYRCDAIVCCEGYFGNSDPVDREAVRDIKTKDIAAGGRVTLEFVYKGKYECVEGTGGFIEAKPSVELLNYSGDLSKMYHFTGKEYDEYIANGGGTEGFYGNLKGYIGDAKDASLMLDGQEGRYYLPGGERTVKVEFYNPATGELQLEAFLNGSKIGYFNGIWKIAGDDYNYKGNFYNTKTGVRVNFDLTGK